MARIKTAEVLMNDETEVIHGFEVPKMYDEFRETVCSTLSKMEFGQKQLRCVLDLLFTLSCTGRYRQHDRKSFFFLHFIVEFDNLLSVSHYHLPHILCIKCDIK